MRQDAGGRRGAIGSGLLLIALAAGALLTIHTGTSPGNHPTGVPPTCLLRLDHVTGEWILPDPDRCPPDLINTGPASPPEELPTLDARAPDGCEPVGMAGRSAVDGSGPVIDDTCARSGGRREKTMSYCNQAAPPHSRCPEDHSRHDWSLNVACAVDCGDPAPRRVCQKISVYSDGSRLYTRTCEPEIAVSTSCSQNSRCWGYVFVGNDEGFTSRVNGLANYSQ